MDEDPVGDSPTTMMGSDPRVLAVCTTAFPESPAFAEYLGKRMQQIGLSVESAQRFVEHLREHVPTPIAVTDEAIGRLGVDNDPDLYPRLAAHMRSDPAIKADLWTVLPKLGLRLRLRIHTEKDAAGNFDHDIEVARDFNPDDTVAAMNLFMVAVAALSGSAWRPDA